MPEKDGAEEKTTKSVVNKKQKQMMGEEGYDVARDEGRVKPSKDKKDGTTMTPSKEMEKTRKLVKGKSALERVKADIEKRYGKGAIMNVKKKEEKKEDTKEELDLTKVAEAFGGHIVEGRGDRSTVSRIITNIFQDPKGEARKFRKRSGEDKLLKNITGRKGQRETIRGEISKSKKLTAPKPGEVEASSELVRRKVTKTPNVKSTGIKITDKNVDDIRKAVSGQTTDVTRDLETIANRTNSGSQPRPSGQPSGQGNLFGGEDPLRRKNKPGQGRPRGVRSSIPTAQGQTKLADLEKQQAKFDDMFKDVKKTKNQRTSSSGPEPKYQRQRVSSGGGKPDVETLERPRTTGGGGRKPLSSTSTRGNTSFKNFRKSSAKVTTNVSGGGSKKALKAVSKRPVTRKVIGKLTKGGLAKVGGKALGKGLGKMALKQIPGFGTAIAGIEAGARFATGDYLGAALSAAEAIPGLGLAAGAANVARDVRRATKFAKKAKGATRVFKGYTKSGKKITKKFTGADVLKRKERMQAAKVPKALRGKKGLLSTVGAVTLPGAKSLLGTVVGGARKAGDAVGHVGRRSAGSM